jgi:hypothetical protein
MSVTLYPTNAQARFVEVISLLDTAARNLNAADAALLRRLDYRGFAVERAEAARVAHLRSAEAFLSAAESESI